MIPTGDHTIETRICALSGQQFCITDLDQYLYEKIGPRFGERHFPIPFPDLCPDMRYMNRLSWRNERNFHSRECSLTGQNIITVHDEHSPFPVYDQDVWWSDNWSTYDYGVSFDFERPFFDQFVGLYKRVPQISLNTPHSENSKYCNQSQRLKDCYITFCSDLSEKCFYGMWNNNCERCFDCSYIKQCQHCYEGLNLDTCNNCFYSEDLINCSSVWYSKNLTGCQHCFGCCNLTNKQHHIFNKPYSPQEYEAEIEKLRAEKNIQTKVDNFVHNQIHKFYHGFQIEASTGDYIRNVKNTHNCYNSRESEVLRHSQDAHEEKYCIDLTETLLQDFCINIEGSYNNSNCGFCMKINESTHSWYSSHIYGSQHVLGSVGVKKGKYVIFNIAYSTHEYEELAAKIVAHMVSTSELGKHFPIKNSPFPYNVTTAQEYFPMTKAQALNFGFRWKDEEKTFDTSPTILDIGQYDERIVGSEQAQSNISTLLTQKLICEATGKPYGMQKRELAFYVENSIQIPRFHPDERYKRRMGRRNPRRLNKIACQKCSKELLSTYTADAPKKVYCESCYRSEVY